jgi:hypothetical protein
VLKLLLFLKPSGPFRYLQAYYFSDIWAQAPAWQSSRLTSIHGVIPVISQWLRECYTQPDHARCREKPLRMRTALPHRVIDVGPANGSRSPRLVMSQGTYGPYTFLSHCWGDYQTFVTTKEMLAQNLTSIPMSFLPETFQDAIEITRRLGFQYLWTDSLCIIQDDELDWEIESGNIISTYEKATLTLAATSAIDSRGGFLLGRQHTSLNVNIDPSQCDSAPQDGQIIHVRSVPPERTVRKSILEAPLNQHAWVLQEMLLSSQIVHFAGDQMYWQCCSRLASEDGLLNERSHIETGRTDPGRTEDTDFWLHSRIFDLVGNLTSNVDWWTEEVSLDYWWTIVEEYSRRQLTEESDRLPALAGLTKFFQMRTGDTPLTGLWLADLLYGLL